MAHDKHSKSIGTVAFILGALLLLWWLLQRRAAQQAADDATVQAATPTDPITDTYASNPDAFNPPSLGTVNINIGNQGLSYLSNDYIPLFGFVGMAQGVMYQ